MTVLALTGGIGGTKLAVGLARLLEPDQVVFLVNTGDDFEYFGLHISPDLDTLTYTLGDIADPRKGWGRADETWNCAEAMGEIGHPLWFHLGDRDLAVHIHRTHQLRKGETLTTVSDSIARALGINHSILPMSDEPVRTVVTTDEGELPFQHYFVRHKCVPRVSSVNFAGAERARLNSLLNLDTITRVIICPSNPYLSIDPMLSIDKLRSFLQSGRVPVIAVSPIVSGSALKGPTAKMMNELGLESTAANVARHYQGLITGFVLDQQDNELATEIQRMGIQTKVLQTIMHTLEDRIQLAQGVLRFGETLIEA